MTFSRASNPIMHFDDDKGHPLVFGKLYTFVANTNDVPAATYKDSKGTLNSNPVILDSRGECEIWLDPKIRYKFVLKREDGSFVREEKEVTASAHIKATLPLAVDDDHLKVDIVSGVAVLSLSDRLIEKLRQAGVDVDG